jgi:hypothetical protein
MPEEPEPQDVLVNRILQGTATLRDVKAADANFQEWIQQDWDGRLPLATAWCVEMLAEACHDWDSLDESDAVAHIQLFSLLCPSRAVLSVQAHNYISWVERSGGLRAFAQWFRKVRGEPLATDPRNPPKPAVALRLGG